jgi:hypothetical protein
MNAMSAKLCCHGQQMNAMSAKLCCYGQQMNAMAAKLCCYGQQNECHVSKTFSKTFDYGNLLMHLGKPPTPNKLHSTLV